MHTNKTGVIILAAGASSRLGSPKQLLAYSGATLLQHSIDAAQSSDASSVLVVLGANADLIKSEIGHTAANVVVNPEWKEGMASTIRCGLQTLVEMHPETEALIFMVADQPFVTAALLNNLMELNRNEQRSIVASKYGSTFGTPVLFTKRFFPELMELTGDVGAKSLVRKYMDEATFVSFPKGEIDIDTVEDYKNLSEE
ncbi:nucleotidyltransferase family protein [Lacibacter sediminis]|uniref:Nucleotidyltransferase family protein n=2 Tax=Lacibacter sediminis TaxID=2760713 RepID=A0A7G5XMM8_9BACT|nr:nucleotidyltransferase family protein [Lacibacter sediminis]